jgi:hypothetical protein
VTPTHNPHRFTIGIRYTNPEQDTGVDKVAHKSLAYRFSEDSSEDAVIVGDDSGTVALLLIQ